MATLIPNELVAIDESVIDLSGKPQIAQVDKRTGYVANIDAIRDHYYPTLRGTIYLDHAGATTYPNVLIDAYADDLKSSLFGNPHSASASSQLSTRRIDTLRVQILQHVNADPNEFDIIFVVNATAAIKLVADAFRDHDQGFWYGYHCDAHTSLVGVREMASLGRKCMTDIDVDRFLQNKTDTPIIRNTPLLFAYPGQSNMTGQRYSLDWCRRIRQKARVESRPIYSIYDAAGLLTTGELDLGDFDHAPDFTVLSFYKIYGFPDLGALIVRKASAHMLTKRKYFGGGTVHAVATYGIPWHARKEQLRSSLEDGTLPFHTIIALEHAIKMHKHIFGSIRNISRHARYLTSVAYRRMRSLRHANGRKLCEMYSSDPSKSDTGPIVTFNLVDNRGQWISIVEVEKVAVVRGIQLRTGGLCNPGGTARHLNMSSDQIQKNYNVGQRCGGAIDIFDGQPTGTIRISFGASSALGDIDSFISFLEDFFIDHSTTTHNRIPMIPSRSAPQFIVDSLTIYPIKSCQGFSIPAGTNWKVHPKGLQFDREWCLVHKGTNVALDQKHFPQMALLRPSIDLDRRTLRIAYAPTSTSNTTILADTRTPASQDISSTSTSIEIDLDETPVLESIMHNHSTTTRQNSIMCGELIPVSIYTSSEISRFFSTTLDVPCTLARFSPDQPRHINLRRPNPSSPESSPERPTARAGIKLSNESPILLISKSSVNQLNQDIQTKAHRDCNSKPKGNNISPEIRTDSFRANIVIALSTDNTDTSLAYLEDEMRSVSLGGVKFDVLGPCQRCQMVCVDQRSGIRRMEPFSTLAKTRRRDGRVWFGVHLCLACDVAYDEGGRALDGDEAKAAAGAGAGAVICVGDSVDVDMC